MHSRRATSRLNELRRNALSINHNYVGVGRYLHFYRTQTATEAPKYGHRPFGFNGVDVLFGGFVVDNTNHDLVKSEDMGKKYFCNF